MNFLQKIRKTMGDSDGGFAQAVGGNAREAFFFFISLLLLVGAVTPARLLTNGEITLEGAALSLLAHSFWWVLGWGIAGPLAAHAVLWVMKWGKPLAYTFCAFFYGATPMLLFMWVPWLGILTPLISLGNVVIFLDGKEGALMKPIFAVLVAVNAIAAVMFLGYYLGQV